MPMVFYQVLVHRPLNAFVDALQEAVIVLTQALTYHGMHLRRQRLHEGVEDRTVRGACVRRTQGTVQGFLIPCLLFSGHAGLSDMFIGAAQFTHGVSLRLN